MPGSNPYLLYAASNFGSFLGILVYPLLIEPRLDLDIQYESWRNAYLILLSGIITVIFSTLKSENWGIKFNISDYGDDFSVIAPTISDRLRWIFIAALPVSLSLSLTSYITQDIGSFPLLWVLPLGLYLLSYIRGFKLLNKPTFLASPYKYVLIAIVFLGFNPYFPIPPQIKFILSAVLFYQISLSIHNYLYQFRPGVAYLTQFYLCTALGGVTGGLINALVAPTAYKFTIEYAMCLVLCLLINPVNQINVTTHDWRSKFLLDSGFMLKQYNIKPTFWDRNTVYIIILASAAIGYILFGGGWYFSLNFKNISGVLVPLILFTVAILKLDSTKFQQIFVISSIFGLLFVFKPFGNSLFADRSYFGNLQVIRSDTNGGSRVMLHGITMHGFQSDSILDNPPFGLKAPGLAYYTAVKELVEKISDSYNRPVKVGMVGMGAGISAMYTSGDDALDFYEIDPLVVKVATDNNYFTYINKSPAKVNIIEGDARLSLARSNQKYDLLVLDAFSSDAIPTHLLTKEAFEIYQSRMAPGGVILVHISNRYFDLSQAVAATVHGLGKVTLKKDYNPTPESARLGEAQAKWLVVGTQSALNKYFYGWNEVVVGNDVKAWTDNYSNLLGALRLFVVK
ncbi:hypothetical protein CAL7716_102150 (plasmid) [Calothrix sp. PCC 7716]|nr:hypothetical protein CAL7716_102150 [Calothrix sp. PCC 7716]